MRKCFFFFIYLDFTGSSYGKESACNAGDPGLISGSGRSPGEGNGNLLQYPCLKNSMDRPWGCKESDTTEQLTLSDSAFSSFIYSFIISYRFIGFYILWILIHDYHYLFECSNCSRFQWDLQADSCVVFCQCILSTAYFLAEQACWLNFIFALSGP